MSSHEEEQSNKIGGLLAMFEAEEQVANELLEKEKAMRNAPLPERIQFLYGKVLDAAKTDIDRTYIEDMFNPETTKLDQVNLYLNLNFMQTLQQFGIMEFYYDTNSNKVSADEYNIEYYAKTMAEESEKPDEERYGSIVERNMRLGLYTHLFQDMYKCADKTTFNEFKRKHSNILALLEDEDDSTFKQRRTVEDGLLEDIERKTIKDSVIMITADLTQYFHLTDVPANEEAVENVIEEDDTTTKPSISFDNDDKNYIKYIGKWRERAMYEISNTNDRIKLLKGFTRGAFFINEGEVEKNKFIINPDKPLLYFNVVDNPMLDKPILKAFVLLETKFFATACTFFQVQDLED